mgnify:CR=1 FL=1
MEINFNNRNKYFNNDGDSIPMKYMSFDEYKRKKGDVINKCGNKNIVPSKVLVIQNLSLSLNENIEEEFSLKVDTDFLALQDGTIIDLDITAKDDIVFDDKLTLEKIKSIIRRCGILEKYKEYFSNDPEIIINSYTLNVKKVYKYFDEFLDGVLIAEEIFY